MKTSDKELDNLFSSKLDGLETEPSSNLWGKINFELDKKPKKKSFVPILRIAAGLIVVLSVGLLLMQNNQQVVKNKPVQKITKQQVEQAKPEIKQPEILVEKKETLLLHTKNKVVKEAWPKRNKQVFYSKINIQPKEKQADLSTQTSTTNKPQQDLGNMDIAAVKAVVVPDLATKLKVQPENETLETKVNAPQILPAKRSIAATIVKRKGVRNMGDLVNLVMAKVDKRNDKLIEFSDSDDGDESNITGINLGIITIKKEK